MTQFNKFLYNYIRICSGRAISDIFANKGFCLHGTYDYCRPRFFTEIAREKN